MSALPQTDAAASVRQWLRAYRGAALRFGRAFARGDVNAIEDAFSQMQELEQTFERGEIGANFQSLQRTKAS